MQKVNRGFGKGPKANNVSEIAGAKMIAISFNRS